MPVTQNRGSNNCAVESRTIVFKLDRRLMTVNDLRGAYKFSTMDARTIELRHRLRLMPALRGRWPTCQTFSAVVTDKWAPDKGFQNQTNGSAADNKTMHAKPDLRVPIEAMISVPAR